jgi:hypothetical protein
MGRRFLILALGALLFAACAPMPPAEPTVGEATTITLSRSVCFGFCPDYAVSIDQDGVVAYEGRRFVNVAGAQRAHIPVSDVQALLARFDAVNFMSLRDQYRAQVTDLPTYTVTLVRHGRSKTVLDYGGPSAGMPASVRDLQDEIDRVAGTARWVLRDGQPVREATPRN